MARFVVRTFVSMALGVCVTTPLRGQEQPFPNTGAGGPPPGAYYGPPMGPPAAPTAANRVFQPTDTIAVVGNQHILAGDVLGEINMRLRPHIGKASEEELEEARQMMLRQALPSMVDNKILYLEFLRKVPPDRLEEVRKNLYEEFDEEKLGPAMTNFNVNSPAELDQYLRQFGSSLEKQRRAEMERKLGRAMLAREINYKPEITHEAMLEYYRTHTAEFDVAAKAKYEQLTTRFANHQTETDPSGKVKAWETLAAMGNEVLRGAKFEAVAQKHSEAANAAQGGKNDWISRGSLASASLEEAVFSLPIGLMSAIIEDERGFHIIRVIERNEAHRIEFVTAQADIKEKLKKEKIQKQVEEVLVKLKAKTSVWTVFDDEPPVERTVSRPASGDPFSPGRR